MSKKCLIISGGDKAEIPNNGKDFDFIIACDSGYKYAQSCNIVPNLITGDFDSSDKPLESIETQVFPVLKDDTDTMLAIKEALNRGYYDITLCCALGGRLDHAFANIQSGAFICSKGGKCQIISDDTKIYCFKNSSLTLQRIPGWSLSVFSLSDKSEGVSITGCKFPLDNAVIESTFPIGVSNIWSDDTATVSCSNGILMVILSKLRGNEHI